MVVATMFVVMLTKTLVMTMIVMVVTMLVMMIIVTVNMVLVVAMSDNGQDELVTLMVRNLENPVHPVN